MHTVLAEGLGFPDCPTARQGARGTRIPTSFLASRFRMRGYSFPWREEDVGPLGILLGEILLKQTRAEKVATIWPVLSSWRAQ